MGKEEILYGFCKDPKLLQGRLGFGTRVKEQCGGLEMLGSPLQLSGATGLGGM